MNKNKGVVQIKKSNLLMFGFLIAGVILLVVSSYDYLKYHQAKNESKVFVESFIQQKTIDDIVQHKGEDVTKEDAIIKIKEGFYNPFLKHEYEVSYGENIGVLEIPSIDKELPIVEGTDDSALTKGVGHFETSSFPLDNDQIVLSGHRDTVFRELGDLRKGDHITVTLDYGKFTYEVVDYKIVDAEDRTIIVPHDEETLTVTTCYPFYYVGNAPERYIVNAKPVWN